MRTQANLFSILLIIPLLLFAYSSSYGKSLTRCAANGDNGCLEALIIKGEDINKHDRWGWTPLLWAVYYDKPETVEFLIKKGANVNARTMGVFSDISKNSTALIIAATYDQIDIAIMLIKNGAVLDAVNEDGQSAYSTALSNKYADMQELLEKGPSGMASKKIRGNANVNQTDGNDLKTERKRYHQIGIGFSVGAPSYLNFVTGGFFSHYGIQFSGLLFTAGHGGGVAAQLDLMYLFKNDQKFKYGISLMGNYFSFKGTDLQDLARKPWSGIGLSSYINFHSFFLEAGLSLGLGHKDQGKGLFKIKNQDILPIIQIGYICLF